MHIYFSNELYIPRIFNKKSIYISIMKLDFIDSMELIKWKLRNKGQQGEWLLRQHPSWSTALREVTQAIPSAHWKLEKTRLSSVVVFRQNPYSPPKYRILTLYSLGALSNQLNLVVNSRHEWKRLVLGVVAVAGWAWPAEANTKTAWTSWLCYSK